MKKSIILFPIFLISCVLVSCGQKESKQTDTSANAPKEEAKQANSNLTGSINDHEWVDLGLPSGIKWATCNVGASSPSEYGNYFAWGETSPKAEYTAANSLISDRSHTELESAGIINSSGTLTSSYDAATANWGSPWRMPTKAEFEELEKECNWTWTTDNGTNGYIVTGPNGKTIFLPAAGNRLDTSYYAGEFGYYWSASAGDGNSLVYDLGFDSKHRVVGWGTPTNGEAIRPVSE